MSTEPENDGGHDVRPDYKHAIPVIVMVVVGITAALIARALFVPATFGEYGYYRAASIDEEKARAPRHAGRAACAECHDDIATLHAGDAHSLIECETCHGLGAKHIKDPTKEELSRADSVEDCLVCHTVLDARPGSFPQIDIPKHFKAVGVRDEKTACIKCHSGHTPLFMDRDLHKARLHPLVHDCGDCHVGRTDRSLKKPDTHPTIFQCNSCHAELYKSFEKAPHAKLNCKTCHLFIKENSFSGKIVRNADPRFCLLCHRNAPFKSPSGPPTIDWPSHLSDVSKDAVDPKRSCASCHQDKIHALYPKETPHGL